MARTVLLDTNTANLAEIFSTGKIYRVPTFQRDYSWNEENWEDLWSDLVQADTTNQQHYMGSIVLQTKDRRNYSVIDGQQRLATLSLIVLAALRNLQELITNKIEIPENTERSELLRRKYLGSKDAVSLNYSSKLFLNENNDSFYQGFLLQLRTPPNRSRINLSERLLLQAYEFFVSRIREHLGKDISGERIAAFVDVSLAEKLMFIQITVEDELNAYTVFETLNARGVELTTADLLKNYLLSVASSSIVDQRLAKEAWSRTVRQLGLSEFPRFLRHYWNSRNPLIRKERLFREIRSSVKTPGQAFDLLEQLEETAALHSALTSPTDEFWEGDREIRNLVRAIDLFNVSQCYPLLFSAYKRFNKTDFSAVLRLCMVISFRYNVIANLQANTQEDVYNQAATGVSDGTLNTVSKVAFALKNIYPDDERFKAAFGTKTINTVNSRQRKLVRYILFSIETHLSKTYRDYEDDAGTIEHILPENLSSDWQSVFEEDQHEAYIYRLGNLTLLEKKLNSDCQDKSFEIKLDNYHKSQYVVTNQIDFNEWTVQQIRSRQELLARAASAIWRISQFD